MTKKQLPSPLPCNQENRSPMADQAIKYAEAGYKVFPLYHIDQGHCTCPKGAKCPDNTAGKHPWYDYDIKHGVKNATLDINQIKKWWSQWPEANIGIATGNGLVVVDIDPKNGGSLEALAELGELPDTMTSKTGGGGYHLFYKYPPDMKFMNSTQKLSTGIDIRANGGYVVAPPSNHLSGGFYRWERQCEPVQAPGWLLNWELTRGKQKKSPVKADQKKIVAPADQKINKRGPYVQLDSPLIASQAFHELTKNEIHILLRFMQKRKWDNTKKPGHPDYYITTGLTFPWGEATDKLGISEPTFNRAIQKLIAVGFLEFESRGNKLTRTPTIYRLVTRWKNYDKSNFQPVEYQKMDPPALRRYREENPPIKNDRETPIKNDREKGKRPDKDNIREFPLAV